MRVFQGWGFSAFFSRAPDFLNPLRSAKAIEASQNPHPSRAEGWGTPNSKPLAASGPPAHMPLYSSDRDHQMSKFACPNMLEFLNELAGWIPRHDMRHGHSNIPVPILETQGQNSLLASTQVHVLDSKQPIEPGSWGYANYFSRRYGPYTARGTTYLSVTNTSSDNTELWPRTC